MSNKPTEAQIKEFWEWCGLHYYPDCECIRVKGSCWGISEETYGENGHWHFVLPEIDLNNLFKYAVPKLDNLDSIQFVPKWNCQLGLSSGQLVDAFGEDPALALFWALWEVKELK